MVSNLVATALSFVGLFYITRYLGEDLYGTVAWGIAIVATINSVSDLGFNTAHIKRISEGKDLNDCVSTYAVIQIVLISVMAIMVTASILIWVYLLGNSISGTMLEIIVLLVLNYILFDLASIATNTFVARTETVKGQIVTLINPLIRVPLVIFVSINMMTAIDLVLTYVITAIVVAIAALYLLYRDRITWKKPTLFRSYYQFALPIALITIVGAVSTNLPTLLIGLFGTSADVAYYASGQTILGIYAIVGIAVAALAFPSFSKMHAEGNLEGIRKVSIEAERIASMLGMPIAIVIIIFPTQVAIALLGARFAPAGEPMRYLTISMLLTLLNSAHTSQILATNNPTTYARISMAGFILNAVLLFIFIPSSLFGIGFLGLSYTGAAMAGLLTTAFSFVITRMVAKRLTGTKSNPRILLHIISAEVAGISLVVLSIFSKMDGIIMLFVYGILSMAIFASVLWVLRELTQKDIDFILDTINPAKMRNYISDEIKK